MPQWYETPPEQRTNEQTRRCQQSYYHALLSTPEGREIFCDMQRRIRDEKSEDSAAQLCMERYYEDTLALCGVDNLMSIVEAEARIAKSYIHKEVKPDTPEGFAAE